MYTCGLSITWLIGTRLIAGLIYHRLYAKRLGLKSCVVIGAQDQGQDLVESLLLMPSFGYFYEGTFSDCVPDTLHFHLRHRFRLLGSVAQIESYLDQTSVETVFVTIPIESGLLEALNDRCQCKGMSLYVLQPPSQHVSRLSTHRNIDGHPFIYVSPPTFPPSIYVKRLFDVIFSVIILVVTIPLLLGIALLIKWTSPNGPVLYIQERVGYRNRCFQMVKFRTMHPVAESNGPQMVGAQDDRYIPFGAFLRKTSLDELPQLLNILKGDMSLVGPRPERPFFVEQFKQTIPDFELRHLLRPGITGWAQINGRSVLTHRPDHKLRYDLYYIRQWSFLLDIKIILKTIFVVLKREEAY